MGKYDGWLFVSDVDGTLLSNPEYTLSNGNREAITEFIREGGKFTFASGRCLYSIMPLYRELKTNAPLVLGNGALIYDPTTDTFPYVSEIDKDLCTAIYNCTMSRFDGLGFEILSDRVIYFIDDNSSIQHHIHSESIPYPFVKFEEATGPWVKLAFGVVPKDMETVSKIVRSSPYAKHFNIAQGGEWYLELSAKTTSKSVAVLKVAEELGIPTDKIITLGDNENDLSMFSITPHSFAVSNASDEIKKAVSHVVGVGGLHGQVVRDVLNILF